jgi:hypothetical protein
VNPLDDGMQVAAGFFVLAVVLVFSFEILGGFISFMKRMLG